MACPLSPSSLARWKRAFALCIALPGIALPGTLCQRLSAETKRMCSAKARYPPRQARWGLRTGRAAKWLQINERRLGDLNCRRAFYSFQLVPMLRMGTHVFEALLRDEEGSRVDSGSGASGGDVPMRSMGTRNALSLTLACQSGRPRLRFGLL
jgi:hypothetical protein